MSKLTREDLYSLEEYSQLRPEYRTKVMQHKKSRQLPLGEHVTLYFEDRLTMQYQIQEMLRAERIFESAGIQEELDAYNPLIPDGNNWKATMMVEYSDVDERQKALAQLIGIEAKTYMQVEGFDKVYPIADEDLDRETEAKTSAVHFLRFELNSEMIRALKDGAALNAGVEHENYQVQVAPVRADIRESLSDDLEMH